MKSSLFPQFYCSYSISDSLFSLLNHNNKKYNSDKLINYFGKSKIYYTNYARTSLRVFLSSLKLKTGAKVGVQAYNCHTVFQAIKNAGYFPVFIDINENFTLNIKDLTNKSNQIDVLIITHTFGIPAELDIIKKLFINKIIIEDCAHSLFSRHNNQSVGSFGDASIFSFGYGKYPSIGPGGFICINNINLVGGFENEYNKLKSPPRSLEIINIIKNFFWALFFKKTIYGLFTYPIGKKLDNKLNFTGKSTFIESKGYASNINLFLHKFNIYYNKSKIQTRNGEYLYKHLSETLKLSKSLDCQQLNYFIFPVLSKKRDLIISFLFRNGYEAGKYFSKSLIWAREFGYNDGLCPKTEDIVDEIYTIPCYFSMNKNQLDRIINLIKENKELFCS